ncbi:MAG TPA: amidohydrolase family protein, partial [Thermomicrobiaceae bacterium]|nr:amidohydrolase family protein [Thermomicrobiaceae bacterium]
IGLELAIPLLLRLVESNRLDLGWLIDRLSTAPARLFNLPGGRLRPGSPADIVVIDPNREWTVSRDTIASRSLNTPLLGMKVRGAAIATIVGGEVRYLAEF